MPPPNANRSSLWVTSEPTVTDPREMATILTSSLRSLFGESEPHSCLVQVEPDNGSMRISCPRESTPYIRSALTMVTPPPYLLDNLYRFDVVKVEENRQ